MCSSTAAVAIILAASATLAFSEPFRPVYRIAAGDRHSLFLRSDGTAWATGSNAFGQLGDGSRIDRHTPVQVLLNGVQDVGAGWRQSLFRGAGGVFAAGSVTNSERPVASSIADVRSGVQTVVPGWDGNVFLRSDGRVSAVSPMDVEKGHSPQFLPISGVRSIAAGWRFLLLLRVDGTVWAVGFNGNGRFGDGSTIDRLRPVQVQVRNVQSIAAGDHHSLFLTGDGNVHAAGYNGNGQLGDGTTTERYSPVRVPLAGVQSIAAGSRHSLFLLEDGTVHSAGDNAYGQLGDGSTSNRHFPVQVPSERWKPA